MFSSKIPIILFFIICILAVTYLLYKVRAKITDVEGFNANPLVDIDAGGSDQYSPIRGSNPDACEQACLNLTKNGKNCPAYVMDFRTDGGVPRNNCWLKHSGINDNNMYYAPGVTTYNLSARLNCPTSYNGALLPPKSDPSGGNIVLGDWDVDQIKNIHKNVKATSGDNIGKTFNVSDNEMMEYIRISTKELNVPYELIGNPTVAAVKIDGSGGKCPPPPTKKWMFTNTYSSTVQSYVNNSILNYAQFTQFAKLNKIASFTTIEGLAGSTKPKVTSTNVTNNIVTVASSVGFTLEQTTDMSFNEQVEKYIREANSSETDLFSRLVKMGITTNTDYNKLLTEMESGIGFVKSFGAAWFVDILPQHGVKSPEKMKLFRENMAKGLYKNFGFVKPYYPAVQYQGPSVYFWYLDQLAKLGVGVDEFEGFSTIHKSVFGVTPNSGSKLDLNSGSWEMTKLFPTDPFLPLVPIYTTMGFTYRTSNSMEDCKTNFNTFCTTVQNFKPPLLMNKLKMFSNRMKEYGMSSFLEYVAFIDYLTSTVGGVNDLVATMNTYKDYMKNTSGLTLPADKKFKTGTVEIYGDAKGDVSSPTKTTVEIFDYQIAKWFIDSKLKVDVVQTFKTIEGIQNIQNKYGVSPSAGITFTNYITDIHKQNMNYNTVLKPMIEMNANYKEYEVRSSTMANKTYNSIPYDANTDPSKMRINGFENMESDSWMDTLGDWFASLFSSSSSSEKEGLDNIKTDNTKSDKETLSRFGVNDANNQLPQIFDIFIKKYNVNNFNEMIYLISCLQRVGVFRVDLDECITQMNQYRITKEYLDVFTKYMQNLGFTTWSNLLTFMKETYRFGINNSPNANMMDYKQFIYMMRKWGCNFKSRGDINLLYGFIWMCNDYLELKYSHKVSNSTKLVSRDIVGGNPTKIEEWRKMADNIHYLKRDKTLDKMAEKDKLIYSVSIIDNFIENMIGRGYSFKHLGIVFSKIIVPMYLLNIHPHSKDAYKTYPDLFFYINTKNPPYPPLDGNKKEMEMGQYLSTSLINYPGNIKELINAMGIPKDNKYISDFITEFSQDMEHLQWQYGKEQMNKVDIPIKIENMVSFVYNDEYNSIMKPLSSEYSKLFGTDDKIIAYMMDMVLGMRNWLEEVKNAKPFEPAKYNAILPTLNAIILHPIFMFRWMEQQMKMNAPMCTPEAKAKLQNQNQCYSTIPTSQMARKRNSYIEPPVKGNPRA